jgi:hypothetical protein
MQKFSSGKTQKQNDMLQQTGNKKPVSKLQQWFNEMKCKKLEMTTAVR